ncbi:30S small subunit ribosomal protein S17 [Cryptococcus wingfieldii CBS 7118]|uniref:30S small subunit ribosomal protein S17 n=1 Tax=Cryptococcus wingfieldii CBS 7118 TaxID=1295528 RepID=A0A1E3K2V7_9TREE|nr:30S small subunit ribosomal protein S17 [Cryptococcus wingfieldii CBS 7118]ODO07359.1 30S small subunit ribosomal protein S17 [Cryptococcus wingfieldii CBS 7118]
MPYQPNHIFKGVVTKVGVMRKTATVTVERTFEHPKILKEVKRHKKYLAHDEGEVSRLGDKVTIIHGTRTSKSKSFRLHSILSRDTHKFPNDPIPSVIPPPALSGRQIRKAAAAEGGSGKVVEALKEAGL